MTLQKGTYYLHLYTKGEWAGDSMKFVIKNMNAPKKPVVKKIKSKKVSLPERQVLMFVFM